MNIEMWQFSILPWYQIGFFHSSNRNMFLRVFVFRWTSWTFDVQRFQLRTASQMRHSSNKETCFSLRTALTGSGDSWLMVCVCVCFFLKPTWNCHATKWLDVNCACFTSILLPPNGWPKEGMAVVHVGPKNPGMISDSTKRNSWWVLLFRHFIERTEVFI